MSIHVGGKSQMQPILCLTYFCMKRASDQLSPLRIGLPGPNTSWASFGRASSTAALPRVNMQPSSLLNTKSSPTRPPSRNLSTVGCA